MDRQLIEALIDALERSGLSELEYTRDGESLRLVKGGGAQITPAAPAPALTASGSTVSVPVARKPAQPAAESGTVASPLFGVIHLRPAPDAEPFVAIGQAVAVGQVLCTIEAMKVFTEVRADRAGTIVAIAVTSGQEVESGQVLMRLG